MTKLTLGFALLIALLMAVPASAQTSINTTTLASAITAPSPGTKVISVASATNIVAGSILFIDGEVYRTVSVSGTNVTVITVYRPATHLTSATVYIVPSSAQIGNDPVGSCIRGSGAYPAYSPYTLMFNLSTGEIVSCRGTLGSRTWQIASPYASQLSGTPPQTP